jgi:hypothetical protein
MDQPSNAFEDTEPTTSGAKVYKNIEDEVLVKKIQALESKLTSSHTDKDEAYTTVEKRILKSLLKDFNTLIKTPYGSLSYLVETTSEDIIKLYGVDTDRDFYSMRQGGNIRVANPTLDKMVGAGGNRRFVGEAGLVISDPAESSANAKITNAAIQKIIDAIKEKLA